MNSSPKPPKPTPQERAIQQAQADLLNQNRSLIQQQLQQQNVLAPHLYEQMGLRPRYAMEPDPNNPGQMRVRGDNITGAPVIEGFDRFDTPEQLAQQEALASQRQLTQYQLQQLKTGDLLQREGLKQAGYLPTFDEQGNMTGLALDPNSTAAMQDQTNRMLLERQQKALRGELDVDPGLTREFDRSETALRAQLQKNLGAGYDTSTPGIQSLAEFNQRKGDSLAAARRGEIGYAGQLAMAGQGQARANAQAGQTSGAALQTAMGWQNPFGTPGGDARTAAGYLSAVSSPFGGSGGFGTLAQMYGQSAGPYQEQRMVDYNASVRRQQEKQAQAGGIGALIGGLAGTVFAPGVGTAAGAAIGGAAGTALV